MKLRDLIGDFADLFQDSRISDAATVANLAASTASGNQLQTARLASTVETRIRELEQDNQILSMVLVRLLQHLAKTQPSDVNQILEDVSRVIREKPQNGDPLDPSDPLRAMLRLPQQPKTPILNYTKPVGTGPKPPARPVAASKPKEIGPKPPLNPAPTPSVRPSKPLPKLPKAAVLPSATGKK